MLATFLLASFCQHGAVATAEPYATQASNYILQEGGNAIDAAITASFALAVTYPTAGEFEIRTTQFSHPSIGDDQVVAGYFFRGERKNYCVSGTYQNVSIRPFLSIRILL